MCHFVTGVLPAEASRATLTPILREHGLAFAPLDNDFVQGQLRDGEIYARATNAYCDCGTPLGAARRAPERGDGSHEVRRIEELRKKGWGAAKIERWLEQQKSTRRRDARVKKERGVAVAMELGAWSTGLDALARSA